ncbi:MAG: hypothetical protein AAFX40_01945 [Cyanobacteria bacterium J06639_1]
MTAMYRGRPIITSEAVNSEAATFRGRVIKSDRDIDPTEVAESSMGLTAYDLMCCCLTKGFDVVTRPDLVKVVSWRESNSRRQVTFEANTSLESILAWVNDRYALMYPELAHLNGHVS